MRYHMVWLGLGAACLLGAAVSAHDSDRAAGRQLYQDNCGICHGMMGSDARHQVPGQFPWQPVQVGLRLSGAARVAVAPPYGPSLRGVYGRQAGTVPGFAYSRAFKQILQGVVWDQNALDVWIMDSQAWVPGSLMFYKQPDPDIRREIITYLAANR